MFLLLEKDSVMPKFTEDLEQHKVGHFGFSAVSIDDLESSGYTLATIVCDRSGSTSGFQDAMEAALKSSVEALRKHPNSESIMVRVLTIDSECEEQHGFIPLPDVDTDRYDGMLAARGMTCLFDGCVNGAQAASQYGRQLLQDRYNANGILIVITDGMNNAGKFAAESDVSHVKKAFDDTKLTECLESFTTVLIAVNVENIGVGAGLRKFHADAGFTADMIELKDASPATIAKIGEFITDSVSSTSTSLGTGAASQSIKF